MTLIFNFSFVCCPLLEAVRGRAHRQEARDPVLICHCNGVSERTVRRVVREGAQSVRDVGHACGAGTCCQGCSERIVKILHAERRSHARSACAPMADKTGAASS